MVFGGIEIVKGIVAKTSAWASSVDHVYVGYAIGCFIVAVVTLGTVSITAPYHHYRLVRPRMLMRVISVLTLVIVPLFVFNACMVALIASNR